MTSFMARANPKEKTSKVSTPLGCLLHPPTPPRHGHLCEGTTQLPLHNHWFGEPAVSLRFCSELFHEVQSPRSPCLPGLWIWGNMYAAGFQEPHPTMGASFAWKRVPSISAGLAGCSQDTFLKAHGPKVNETFFSWAASPGYPTSTRSYFCKCVTTCHKPAELSSQEMPPMH